MPKDTAQEPDDNTATKTTTSVVGGVKKASTLSEMWTKKATIVAKKGAPAKPSRKKAEDSEATQSGKGPEAVGSSSGKSSTLIAVTQSILESLEEDTMGESWREVLSSEFQKSYFTTLKKFLLTECVAHTVYPTPDNIYSWSRLTPLNEVKVVILGQDPYHDVGQAHGLSFSVLYPTKPPPSLKNIYKQLEADFPGFKAPQSGDLSPVAKQGVLWLNTSLTVRAHQAGSHARKGWETFTAQVIRAVLQRKGVEQGVVFMAWGLPAQKTFSSLGVDEKKHLLLKSAHPSPLSAHRGFLGNGHFKKANEWLCQKYGKEAEIDWTILSAKR